MEREEFAENRGFVEKRSCLFTPRSQVLYSAEGSLN